jgi:hypothetical protein
MGTRATPLHGLEFGCPGLIGNSREALAGESSLAVTKRYPLGFARDAKGAQATAPHKIGRRCTLEELQ